MLTQCHILRIFGKWIMKMKFKIQFVDYLDCKETEWHLPRISFPIACHIGQPEPWLIHVALFRKWGDYLVLVINRECETGIFGNQFSDARMRVNSSTALSILLERKIAHDNMSIHSQVHSQVTLFSKWWIFTIILFTKNTFVTKNEWISTSNLHRLRSTSITPSVINLNDAP